LAVHEMAALTTLDGLAHVNQKLAWLPVPGPQQRRDTLDTMSSEISAALSASSQFNRLRRLNRAQVILQGLVGELATSKERVRVPLGAVYQQWQGIIRVEIERLTTEQTQSQEIPNPYIPGQPIQQESSLVFAGRRDLFAEIEQSVTAVHQPPTLLLYGPRRSGKTSLLNQLPQQLSGDVAPVFINLQEAAATVFSAAGFVTALAGEIQRQCAQHRRLELPPWLPKQAEAEPYLAFSNWLRQAETALSGMTLFITFDEFEWVEQAIEQERLGEEVLSFFRNLIQRGQPRLALLFAGVRTLGEMRYNWPSYFINVRTVKVGYLPREDAADLLTKPIPDFPLDYAPHALDKLLDGTRCQPYLLQLAGFELINYLNGKTRRAQGDWLRASETDVEQSFRKALEAGHNYFAEIWNSASADERLALADMAAAQGLPPELSAGARLLVVRQLLRKDLIEETEGGHRLQIPLVARWIAEEYPPELVRAERASKGAG
ncbi:MAG: ATP-binding protein, partial [Anaerolineales bacterium]|nr:ATP-binding protein [Anaerolineales bacterium]